MVDHRRMKLICVLLLRETKNPLALLDLQVYQELMALM